MKYCKECLHPETRPGIIFDKNGVCDTCNHAKQKDETDWKKRREELDEIVKWAKEKSTTYDCVVGVSGGKDSHYQALTARDELGLNVLLVNTIPYNLTETGKQNMYNLINFGFDCVQLRCNPEICKILTKHSFTEFGNPVRSSEYPLLAFPLHVAMNHNIPLVIYGENPVLEVGDLQESGLDGDANDMNKMNTLAGGDASIWQVDGVKESDIAYYQIPAREEIEKAGVRAIYIGYYIKWSQYENAQFAIKKGLKIRTDNLEDIGRIHRYSALDDNGTLLCNLMKYIKFGYGYATDEACYDIREGRLTREEAKKLVEKYDGKCADKYIEQFCEYIDITVPEFWKIANSFRGEMWEKDENGKWILK